MDKYDYEAIARQYCIEKEIRYLSNEAYYHSNGKYHYLKIAAEDGSGRFELTLNLK